MLYIGSQQRGLINAQCNQDAPIGAFDTRRSKYIASIKQGMQTNFASLGMDTPIESWFSSRANSANPYQKNEDNRGFEIETVLRILHRIDPRIDPDFVEIDGNGRVYVSVENVKRDLTQLSSGFSSILKIVQAIVSGYGSLTNDLNIEKVRGFVLIDEIDSHLHLSWQARIVSALSDIFSNTTFIVTTHSPLVCIGLKKGEVYRLKRDDAGVVNSEEVSTPKSATLVDVIKDGFEVDLNKEKLDRFDWQSSINAKNELLNLIKE